MQLSLFPSPGPQKHIFVGCSLVYYPKFLSQEEADFYFQILLEETEWKQDIIQVYGKRHLIPRLNTWYGEKSYTYSGNLMKPRVFTPILQELREKIQQVCSAKFDSVLLNLYRNGQDSVGWHADDEPGMDANQPIISLSLGATRRFILREKIAKGSSTNAQKIEFSLSHGDLFIMHPPTQLRTEHTIPKTKKVQEPRINLTFRCLR